MSTVFFALNNDLNSWPGKLEMVSESNLPITAILLLFATELCKILLVPHRISYFQAVQITLAIFTR